MDFPVIAAALLICAALYTDLMTGRIPNRITAGFATVGLALHLQPAAPLHGMTGWVLGLCIGGAMLLIPYLHKRAGGGDLKLFAALGALIGPWAVVSTFLYTGVAWGMLSLLIMVRGGDASCPALSVPWTGGCRQSGTVPFAVPAAAGFLVYVLGGSL